MRRMKGLAYSISFLLLGATVACGPGATLSAQGIVNGSASSGNAPIITAQHPQCSAPAPSIDSGEHASLVTGCWQVHSYVSPHPTIDVLAVAMGLGRPDSDGVQASFMVYLYNPSTDVVLTALNIRGLAPLYSPRAQVRAMDHFPACATITGSRGLEYCDLLYGPTANDFAIPPGQGRWVNMGRSYSVAPSATPADLGLAWTPGGDPDQAQIDRILIPSFPPAEGFSAPSNSGPSTSSTVLSFETPSHNIACEIATFGDDTDEARCDIKQAAWTSPPKPASCQYAWGMALHVTSGGSGFDCVGDTADNDQVVPYGSVEEAGQFRCVVETTGVTCTDTATGHGYAVSKAAYRLF